MFARVSSSLRNGGRSLFHQTRSKVNQQQRRNMGGGSHYMEVSEVHKQLGEVFGFVTWLWIFHRARLDGPVVLGWRHPWEHAEDPWASVSHAAEDEHINGIEELRAEWDTFQNKAAVPGDGDDDEDEDEDDDDDEDDDGEDEDEE